VHPVILPLGFAKIAVRVTLPSFGTPRDLVNVSLAAIMNGAGAYPCPSSGQFWGDPPGESPQN
jgi:hypothetical protein